MTDGPGERGWRRIQYWLPAAYAVLAGAWISASDRALLAASPSTEAMVRWAELKGWAFVAATALLLHLLLRWSGAAREEAMRRLAERERQSRQLVAASPDAMIVQSGFRIFFANAAALRLFGAREAAEVEGRPIWDLLHPDDHEAARDRTIKAARGEAFPAVAVRRMRRLDGTGLRCEVALAPLAMPGHPDAIVVTIRDVTGAWLLLEERERVNAALRVLSACNEALVRAGSEQELMEEVCRVAVQFGGYRLAFVGLAEQDEGKAIRLVAHHGVDDGFLATLSLSWADREGGRGPAGRSLRAGAPVVADDVRRDPLFAAWLPEMERRGLAAVGAFPLLLGAERLGVLALYAGLPGVFDAPVVVLLQQLADDLAFGLAALRTRAALAEERSTLQAILDNASVPMGILDRDGRVVRVNRPFAALSGSTVDELLGRTLGDGMVPPKELAALRAVFERVWAGESPLVHVNHHVARDGSRRLLEWTNTLVRGPGGEPHFMVGLGHDITERVQIEARLRESREQLRALAGRLQTVREEEKARIARDLHDELGQLLTGLKMDLRWLEKRIGDLPGGGAADGLLDRVVAASDLADQTVASVQRIAAELRPGALDRLGLGPTLRQEARRFAQRTGVPCEARIDEASPEPPAEVATALYRICQEAMTNVSRHAGAGHVVVRLAAEAGALVLRVEDDGRGFDGAALGPEALGLLGMTERASALGGTVQFAERDGGGTTVVARIPMAPAAPRPGGPA